MNIGSRIYIRLVYHTVRGNSYPETCFREGMYKSSMADSQLLLMVHEMGFLLDRTSGCAGTKPLSDIFSEVFSSEGHAVNAEWCLG